MVEALSKVISMYSRAEVMKYAQRLIGDDTRRFIEASIITGEDFIKRILGCNDLIERDHPNITLLERSDISGHERFKDVNQQQIDLFKDGLYIPLKVFGSRFRYMRARGIFLPLIEADRADFSGSDLSEGDFRGGSFVQSSFLFTKFYGSQLSFSNFTKAGLIYAGLTRANLERAILENASLEGADLVETYLVGANLKRADLMGADLRKANLKGADLTDANLRGANLAGVDLRETRLYGAILNGTNLSGAKLRGETMAAAFVMGAEGIGSDYNECLEKLLLED